MPPIFRRRRPSTTTALSLSYVTGAHSLKAGLTYSWQFAKDPTVFVIGDVNYRTLNGIAESGDLLHDAVCRRRST